MRPGERTAFIGPKGLKPCPLCGGPASVLELTAGVFWTTPTVEATRIGCDRCEQERRRHETEASMEQEVRAMTAANKLLWLVAIIACPFVVLAMPEEDDEE